MEDSMRCYNLDCSEPTEPVECENECGNTDSKRDCSHSLREELESIAVDENGAFCSFCQNPTEPGVVVYSIEAWKIDSTTDREHGYCYHLSKRLFMCKPCYDAEPVKPATEALKDCNGQQYLDLGCDPVGYGTCKDNACMSGRCKNDQPPCVKEPID